MTAAEPPGAAAGGAGGELAGSRPQAGPVYHVGGRLLGTKTTELVKESLPLHDPAPGTVKRAGRRLALAVLPLLVAGCARVTIDVTAFQWSWQFDYEGSDRQVIGGPGHVPEMVVPVGVPIHIKLRSADVVHSFYVPRALFKRQAIPGTTNEFDMNFQRVGLYHGQCAQYCGVAHSDMLFRVKVVSQDEFERFLTSGRGGAPTGGGT